MLGSCHTARRWLEVLAIDSNAETAKPRNRKRKSPRSRRPPMRRSGSTPSPGACLECSEMTARAAKRIKAGGHREVQAEGAFNITALASSVNSRRSRRCMGLGCPNRRRRRFGSRRQDNRSCNRHTHRSRHMLRSRQIPGRARPLRALRFGR